MRRLFGSDSPVFRFMTILLELAEINILFLLFSLPVITAGASYAAMLESLYQLHRQGEGSFSFRHFRNVFRSSLKPSLPLWCIGLPALAAVLYGAAYWFSVLQGPGRAVVCGVYMAVGILVFGILQHALFILALTGKLDPAAVKNSFLLALAKYPFVILNVLCTASILMVLGMTASVLLRMLPLILLYWFACPAYVCVILLEKEMRPLFPRMFEEDENI